VWGLVLVVLGALAALGMYLNRTGPFGRLVRDVTGAALGTAKVLVPVALVAIGWSMIRGREYKEPIPVGIGSAFLIIAATGLFHLRNGSLAWGTPVSRLRSGGGFLGLLVAEPLQKVVATWGAVIVLSVLVLIGLLIFARLGIREAVDRTATRVAPVGGAAGRGIRSLFTLNGDDEEIDELADEPLHETQKSKRTTRPARFSKALVSIGAAEAGATATRRPAPPLRTERRAGAYTLPEYDDIDPDAGYADYADYTDPPSGFVDDTGEFDGRDNDPDRSGPVGRAAADAADAGGASGTGRRKRARKSKIVDGDAKGWLGDDPATLDPTGAEGARARGRVRITLPPEPVWAEEQPAAEPVPLPGLDPKQPVIVWKLPPRSLLKKGKAIEIDKRAVEALGRTLEEALAAHGVETRLVGMTVGPTVTRFELELAPGVKVAKVTVLQKDIAYAMATADVRMLAPIPGKSAIGVEVPNRQRQLVAVGDVLNTPDAKAFPGPLSVAIGRDIDGKPVMVDLAKMPHVLVAGTTGSGKSSCINSLLASILMRSTPEEVRLILIDPKMVELSQYNGLPHLLTQVVTNPKKAANALQWAVDEMERRYELLAKLGFRDVTGYNAAVERGDFLDPYADDPAGGIGLPPAPNYDKMSFILIVVDELADLMMVAARDVEESICRIAQKARAVGIHLVIATQRPSVNVITGLIKANVPSRFAFAVSSLTDSRVIIDQPGAEKLIGQGDMLMLTVSSNVAQRVQGNFVSEEEIRAVVGFWRKQTQGVIQTLPGVEAAEEAGTREATSGFVDFSSDGGVDRIESATPKMFGGTQGAFVYGGSDELTSSKTGGNLLGDDTGDSDDMLDAAMELIVRSQLGSTSMLQRKLRVGFARAGRIMDLLENKGIVGPSTGSKAREVLMTVEELEALIKRRNT
jgi:energy-coupling factor transporter ATP-binding protein EcfA2